MKIILSRKGFDSGIGKAPSPIFPSCELHSLPIPETSQTEKPLRYGEIQAGQHSLGTLVNDLTRGKITPATPAHLDPDLDSTSRPRPVNWKPLFGQAGAAEGHLQKGGVQAGDIFLFYGWFRQVETINGKFCYVQGAPDLHVIFGWLQIERRLEVTNRAALPSWAFDHPHCRRHLLYPRAQRLDTLYMASDSLQLPGAPTNKPGGGIFPRFHPARGLTAPGSAKRSIWQLPSWFHPAGRASSLSYHGTTTRWTKMGDHVHLQSVGRGQEFVLESTDYPEVVEWLVSILNADDHPHKTESA